MKNSYLTRRIEESYKKNLSELPLAFIWDRIAAFVVDLLIVSLVSNVILSPLKRRIQEEILNQHDGATNFYAICLALGVCAIFVVYQTLSVFLFKKTIGKKVFNLDVVPIIHGQSLTLMNCFVRACSLLISILLLFFPLLEVFSNSLRRPMHDRLADSYVRGLKKTGESPSFSEKIWVRITYAAVLANIAALLMVQIFFYKDEIQNLSEFVTVPEYLCDSVSEAKEYWPKTEKVTRLDVALTLYGIDSVGSSCLEKEAQRAMSYGEELDKAYLAKAFVYERDPELSNKYLKKTCELNVKGEPCLLTQMIEDWSEKDWRNADTLIKDHVFKTPYLKVWAIKHYDKTQDYAEVLKMSDSLWPNKYLNDFIGKYKTLALWKMDKPGESQELFKSTYAHLAEDRKVSFLADVCNLEIEKNCAVTEFKGCQLFIDKMKDSEKDDVPEETLLTYIKTNKCGMTDLDDIIVDYKSQIDDPKIQMYLAGVRAQTQGKNAVAEQIYKNILKAPSTSLFLNYEARSNLLETIEDKGLIEQVEWWLKDDGVGSYHQQLGMKFLKIFSEKRRWDLAEPVAQKLLSSSFKTRELNEMMTVVFYNLKKFNVARKIIHSIESVNERSIASVHSFESFEDVRRQLLKKREGSK